MNSEMAYSVVVSRNFRIRAPEWKFLNKLRILISADGRIRKISNTLQIFGKFSNTLT